MNENLGIQLTALDRLVHQASYQDVMSQLELRVSDDKKSLGTHVIDFYKRTPNSNPFETECLKILDYDYDNCSQPVTDALTHYNNIYTSMGLTGIQTEAVKLEKATFLKDVDNVKLVVDRSIKAFEDSVILTEIPNFNTALVKICSLIHESVDKPIAVIQTLINQPNMELLQALSFQPFLYSSLSPVIFVNLALPILTPGNFVMLLEAIKVRLMPGHHPISQPSAASIGRNSIDRNSAFSQHSVHQPELVLTNNRAPTPWGFVIIESRYNLRACFMEATTGLLTSYIIFSEAPRFIGSSSYPFTFSLVKKFFGGLSWRK